MECPYCLSNTRSIGFEDGDETSCSHCGGHLVLVENPRHWERYDVYMTVK